MNDRHTGLGDSLLLRRTEPAPDMRPDPRPEPAERSHVPDASGARPLTEPPHNPPPAPPHTQPLAETTPAPPAPKPNPPSQKAPQPIRDRCTIYLTPGVNRQLDLVARIERKQRSEVVSDLLRQHLPRYRIESE